MPIEECKPYVVSADSLGLLRSWAKEQGYTLPSDDYFQGMLKDLERTLNRYFSAVEIVPEDFLRQGLNGLIKSSPVPVVSLDRAYINSKQRNLVGFLDVTRTVDSNLNSSGLGSRALEITLERQIRQLAAKQRGKAIALADDVIFGGDTMLQLVQTMRSEGVNVDTVYSGITIKEGEALLEQNKVRVKSLLVYDQVVDEVCERDLVVGVPYSGRSVVNGKGIIEGAPYIYPFGKPVEWASIPSDEAVTFSLFALAQSLQLWVRMEQLSNKTISTQLVAKPVFNLPPSNSMSESLRGAIKGLESGDYAKTT